jgi:hypothetical protein
MTDAPAARRAYWQLAQDCTRADEFGLGEKLNPTSISLFDNTGVTVPQPGIFSI